MDTYLKIKDVCSLLKVDRSTVIRWIDSGKLRAHKLGGGRLWRIRERDLRKFINKG
ncbi:MAG: helix-turn-helix domain-containing protein [Acidobacteriota bacterium]|nr:helix-turn-helix domain-containing protein [Acidobacteriota bacterium]